MTTGWLQRWLTDDEVHRLFSSSGSTHTQTAQYGEQSVHRAPLERELTHGRPPGTVAAPGPESAADGVSRLARRHGVVPRPARRPGPRRTEVDRLRSRQQAPPPEPARPGQCLLLSLVGAKGRRNPLPPVTLSKWSALTATHRAAQWDATRENLHLTLERNMYGLHAPVRLEMERQLVGAAPTPLSLGLPGSGFTRPGNLGLDILTGRDEEIRPEDVLIGASHFISC